MKTQNSLTITALAALLGIALIGSANAGAIFRHGGDRNSDRGRNDTQASQTRSDDNASQQNQTTDDRSTRDKKTVQSRDAKSTSSSGVERRSTPTLHPDRSVTAPAGPTYRIPDSYRSNDRSRTEQRSIDSTVTRNRDNGWRPPVVRNDSKYRRVEDRETFKTPTRSNGYYHYDTGWVSEYDFSCSYGHWVFASSSHARRSIYFVYDYFPYVADSRVIIISRPKVVYVERPIVINIGGSYYDEDSYYLERRSDGIGPALTDIRLAWVNRDADLLLRHVRSSTRVDVLQDGKYSYTLEGSDYRDMTLDAISAVDTIDFTFDRVCRRGDDQIVAYGRHEFYSGYGDRKVAYVSFVLERQGREWVIVEAGSSLRRTY